LIFTEINVRKRFKCNLIITSQKRRIILSIGYFIKKKKKKKGDIFKGIKVKLICRTYSYVDHNMAITEK
jgi:hypothetical protein